MKIITLITWICTSAAMDDCQVYGQGMWEGRTEAVNFCIAQRPVELARLHVQGYHFTRAKCLDQNGNEYGAGL